MVDYDDDTAEPVDDEPDGVKALRRKFERQLKAQSDELAELRAYRQRAVIAAAGFDPEQGVVGLVAQGYQGEWTAEKFSEHARTLGLQPTQTAPASATVETPQTTYQPASTATELAAQVGQLTPVEQARLASQQRVDQLGAASVPDHTPSLAEQIAAAEAKGDWGSAMQLKSAYMTSLRQSTPGLQ